MPRKKKTDFVILDIEPKKPEPKPVLPVEEVKSFLSSIGVKNFDVLGTNPISIWLYGEDYTSSVTVSKEQGEDITILLTDYPPENVTRVETNLQKIISQAVEFFADPSLAFEIGYTEEKRLDGEVVQDPYCILIKSTHLVH